MQQNDDIDRQVRVIQKLHDFFQIYSLESEKKEVFLNVFIQKMYFTISRRVLLIILAPT